VQRTSLTPTETVIDDDWRADFHAGSRAALERCYREQFDTVATVVGRVVRDADQETVVHEVFLRLLTDERLRKSFVGASLRTWLATLARNQAFDYRRRRDRELALGDDAVPVETVDRPSAAVETRALIERFCAEALPAKWARVFEARFEQRLDQQQAARRLGICGAMLAYREHRVRLRLARYLRRGGA
jgi:RNA polymerase sigma-70 factor (ECF subfamily)